MKRSIGIIPVLMLIMVTTVSAIPAMYQRCEVDTNCTLGEFVFDDSYSPITDQICTLDMAYPNGTLSLNDELLTNHTDGWHSHIANLSTDYPEGLYRTYICCDDAGDVSCIDKTFVLGISFDALETGQSGYEQGIMVGISVIAFIFFFLAIKTDREKMTGAALQILFVAMGLFTILVGLNIMAAMAEGDSQAGIASIIQSLYGIFLLAVIFIVAMIIVLTAMEAAGMSIEFAKKAEEE